MGYGVKNNLNLDLAYEKIIKPCIIENELIPFPLYKESTYNAYRCDEISGTISIDYKFQLIIFLFKHKKCLVIS